MCDVINTYNIKCLKEKRDVKFAHISIHKGDPTQHIYQTDLTNVSKFVLGILYLTKLHISLTPYSKLKTAKT